MNVHDQGSRVVQHLGCDLLVRPVPVPEQRISMDVVVELASVQRVLATLVLDDELPEAIEEVDTPQESRSVEDVDVHVRHWKPTEDQHGTNLRLLQRSGSSVQVRDNDLHTRCPGTPVLLVRQAQKASDVKVAAMKQPVADLDEVDQPQVRTGTDERGLDRHRLVIVRRHQDCSMQEDPVDRQVKLTTDGEMKRLERAVLQPEASECGDVTDPGIRRKRETCCLDDPRVTKGGGRLAIDAWKLLGEPRMPQHPSTEAELPGLSQMEGTATQGDGDRSGRSHGVSRRRGRAAQKTCRVWRWATPSERDAVDDRGR